MIQSMSNNISILDVMVVNGLLDMYVKYARCAIVIE